jgi:superfamily II RNA helicase
MRKYIKKVSELNLSTYRSASNKRDPYNQNNLTSNNSSYLKLNNRYYKELIKRVDNIFIKSNSISYNSDIFDDNNEIDSRENEFLKIKSLLNEPLFKVKVVPAYNYYVKIEHSLKESHNRKIIIHIRSFKDDYFKVIIQYTYDYKVRQSFYYDQFYDVINLLLHILLLSLYYCFNCFSIFCNSLYIPCFI